MSDSEEEFDLPLVLKSRTVERKRNFDNMISGMEDNYVDANFAKRLKLHDKKTIQIKYHFDDEGVYRWVDSTIVNLNTGSTHKFYETDDDEIAENDNYQLCPIMVVEDSDGEVRNVCFVSDRFIYSTDFDVLNIWREVGSTFDMSDEDFKAEFEISDDEDDEDDDEEEEDGLYDIKIGFTNVNDIKKASKEITSNIFMRVIKHNENLFKTFNYIQRRDFESMVLSICDEMSRLVAEHIIDKSCINKVGVEKQLGVVLGKELILEKFHEAVMNVNNHVKEMNKELLRESFGVY